MLNIRPMILLVPFLLLTTKSAGKSLTTSIKRSIRTPYQKLVGTDEGLGLDEVFPIEIGVTSPISCKHHGIFNIQGSCRGFYRCIQSPLLGDFIPHFFLCSPGRAFDTTTMTCVLPSQVISPSECGIGNSISELNNQNRDDHHIFPKRGRKKRQAQSLTGFIGYETSQTVNGMTEIPFFVSNEANLDNVINRLTGLKGKLEGKNLTALKKEKSIQIHKEITELAKNTKMENILGNIGRVQTLLFNDILESALIPLIFNDVLDDVNAFRKVNIAQIKVTMQEALEFISHEINRSEIEVESGFNLLENSTISPAILPLASKILHAASILKNAVKGLNSMSPDRQVTYITSKENNGGYLEYFEHSDLLETLNNIMISNQTIPGSELDKNAMAMLDLLFQGSLIHYNMMSFVISTNIFCARKVLSEYDFNGFNAFFTSIDSFVNQINRSMSHVGSEGLLGKLNTLLNAVEQAPYTARISGFTTLINEKRFELQRIESDIHNMLETFVKLPEPETVMGLDFTTSKSLVPLYDWKKGDYVKYAVQHVSNKGLSRVSSWSKPHHISNKTNPVVHIRTSSTNMTRLVYRQFNDKTPELVAILTDSQVTSFRDIDKDLITAASIYHADGAVKVLRSLLDDGADANVKFEKDMTPLHYAAKYGTVDAMEVLMDRNANLSMKTYDDVEPLHLAASSGNIKTASYLIGKGVNVNARTKKLGLTPLHLAVVNNHLKVVRALIGADTLVNNIKTRNGLTALHLAVAVNGDTIKDLLMYSATDINAVTQDGLTPLHLAAGSSDDITVHQILDHEGISGQHHKSLSPVHIAAINDNKEVLARFLARQFKPSLIDEDGSTPLHYAAMYGDLKTILVLRQVDNTLDHVLNSGNKSALDIAVDIGMKDIENALKSDAYQLVKDIKTKQIQETVNCPNDTDVLVISRDNICTEISNVDRYVNAVKFVIPLEKYYKNLTTYTKIFQDFDKDLLQAQNHIRLWRDGDSIIMGIRQTFKLAQEFDPEFSRKYRINKKNIAALKKEIDAVDNIKALNMKITELESKISENKKMLLESSDIPAVRDYFTDLLFNDQEKLKSTQHKLSNDFSIIQELRELTDFLKFVRDDAKKISDETETTISKIETFLEHLLLDYGKFDRHKRIAVEFMDNINKTRKQSKSDLENNLNRQLDLQKGIKEDNKKVDEFMNKITDSFGDMLETKRKLLKQMNQSSAKKILGIILIPFFGAGIPLLMQASEEHRRYTQMLKDTIQSYRDQVDLIMKQVRIKKEMLTQAQKEMTDIDDKSQGIGEMLSTLITVEYDLNDLASNTDALIKLIREAIGGVETVKKVFDDVSDNLEVMIDMAESAKNATQRLEARHFLYNNLDNLQCKWKDVYFKLTSLDECTRNSDLINHIG